jgi:hypothetical protein
MRYAVDYETAEGELRKENCASYPVACALARKRSQEYGSAYVLAHKPGKMASCGSIGYYHGLRDPASLEGKIK